MADSQSYTNLIVGAVQAAAEGDHSRATDELRAAMKLKFDARLARALDLVQIALLRKEKSLALHQVLAPLLPEGFDALASPAPGAPETSVPQMDAVSGDTDDVVVSQVFAPDEFDAYFDTSVNGDSKNLERQSTDTPFSGQDRVTDQRNQDTRELQAIQQMGPPPPQQERHLDREFDNLNDALQQANFARADDILKRTPMHERDEDWVQINSEVRSRWEQYLRSRLSPLERLVQPGLDEAGFHSQDLDARMMFLYGQVDGMTTIADLIDLSGMNEFDAMNCICRMIDSGIIRVR